MSHLESSLLSGQLEQGQVVLFCKRGMADSLTIYSRRDGEKDYLELDESNDKIVDARPKLDPSRPEIRRYYAMLLYSGDEIRKKSNEIVLTVP